MEVEMIHATDVVLIVISKTGGTIVVQRDTEVRVHEARKVHRDTVVLIIDKGAEVPTLKDMVVKVPSPKDMTAEVPTLKGTRARAEVQTLKGTVEVTAH